VPVLAAMECWGIRLDSDYLRNLGNEVATSARALESEIHALSGSEFNIASPKQLAEILFVKLGLPIIKKTKTGASTDADVLEELAAMHPLPAKILEYRTLTKLKGTYIDALPALVNPRTGRLHTTFDQAVAATGRLSSSDPNLQNIPIRSEIGKKIRHAFVADPGFQMVSADYSQIELRVLAHFSQDPAFLDAFRAGVDIHRRTAAEVFGVAEAERSPMSSGASPRPSTSVWCSGRATSAWRRSFTSRAPRRTSTSRATSSATPACASTWMP
jgi:DNA polymerase-1